MGLEIKWRKQEVNLKSALCAMKPQLPSWIGGKFSFEGDLTQPLGNIYTDYDSLCMTATPANTPTGPIMEIAR